MSFDADRITAKITVTNGIDSGAHFAVRMGTGEGCYIPQSVAIAANVHPGMLLDAVLVPNPSIDVRDRTPYLACYVAPVALEDPGKDLAATGPEVVPAPQQEAPSTSDRDAQELRAVQAKAFVQSTLKAGGVWTLHEMFCAFMDDPNAKRMSDLQVYNVISGELRRMFADDECAKWSLWRSSKQTKPGREWFSCYPDRADVDEYEA